MELNKEKVFIIAELSANHNGSLKSAIDSVKAIAKTGADAIKLQTYTAETITLNSEKPDFLIKGGTLWDGKKLFELYKEAYTPWEWHKELFHVAKEEGLICFSSPFDKTAIDFLENLGNPIYKIASFEITDIPLIEYAASKRKPIIFSTGIAGLKDIELALETARNCGSTEIGLLKCTSAYPAPIEEANLSMIADFKERFGVIPGLSDHTLGITAPIVATVFGAKIIEKHFILDRKQGGPDSKFSLEPNEFSQMVAAVREAEKAIGKINYEPTEKMKAGRQFARSLCVAENVNKGDLITEKNLRSVRPGFGMHPKELKNYLGKSFSKNYQFGDRFEG